MDEQELNKKLAEHYGVIEKRRVINIGREGEGYEDEAYFLAETGERITFNLVQVGFRAGYPPLTQSLDACDKWLVPEALEMLTKKGYLPPIMKLFQLWYDELVSLTGDSSNVQQAALALCLAIEKLIDAG